MPDRILRPVEVCRRLAVSRSTLRRMVLQRVFPPPVTISAAVQGAYGWRESVVDAYINAAPARKGWLEEELTT